MAVLGLGLVLVFVTPLTASNVELEAEQPNQQYYLGLSVPD
jgi:hypothetical protein